MEEMQLELKVVGVTFENRQEILKQVYESGGRPEVRLVMEPTNPYDPFAVKVEFLAGGGWKHVGYIPKAVSEEVTLALQRGEIKKVEFGKVAPVASREVLWASIILTGVK